MARKINTTGPTTCPNGQAGLTRRQLVLGTATLALATVLPGCGGSGGSGVGTSATTQTSIAVKTAEIGSGTFSATTQYQANVALPGGQGIVTTSTTDVHHAFLTDSGGVLRAMALALPKTVISVGAESTLLASLFLVPGILTRNSQAVSERITALKALPSYQSALAYVTAQLPTISFQTLALDPTYNTLCLAAAQDYFTGYKGRGTISVGQATDDLFSIAINGPNPPRNPADVTFTMSNVAWRNLRVDRVLIDATGNVTSTQAVKHFPGQMGGGVGVSYGSIFTWSIGNPDNEGDPNPIDFTQNAHAQYWVQGPGFKPGSTPPSSIDTDDSAAWGSSAVAYLVFPLISMLIPISGLFPGAGGLVKMAESVWDLVNEEADVISLTGASDTTSQLAAGKNLLVDMLVAGLENGAFVSSGLLTAAEAASLSTFFEVVGLGLAAYTVGLVFKEWGTYTQRECIQIDSLGNGTVTIQ